MVIKEDFPEFKMLWVKAHQDYHKPVQDLTLNARLNVMVDADANAFRASISLNLELSTMSTIFPSLKAYITINGCVITSKLQHWLKENYTTSDISTHIQTEIGLSISDITLVD
eukprot:4928035-Ditylum_brightwellii.AAC.1